MKEDESMEIRTSTTICGIRGTCGWAESHGDTTTYIGLLKRNVWEFHVKTKDSYLKKKCDMV